MAFICNSLAVWYEVCKLVIHKVVRGLPWSLCGWRRTTPLLSQPIPSMLPARSVRFGKFANDFGRSVSISNTESPTISASKNFKNLDYLVLGSVVVIFCTIAAGITFSNIILRF